jgi:hypothetical protein
MGRRPPVRAEQRGHRANGERAARCPFEMRMLMRGRTSRAGRGAGPGDGGVFSTRENPGGGWAGALFLLVAHVVRANTQARARAAMANHDLSTGACMRLFQGGTGLTPVLQVAGEYVRPSPHVKSPHIPAYRYGHPSAARSGRNSLSLSHAPFPPTARSTASELRAQRCSDSRMSRARKTSVWS